MYWNRNTWKIGKPLRIGNLGRKKFKILLGILGALILLHLLDPLGTNEIKILHWTKFWDHRPPDDVITAGKCPYLKPISGPVFDIPCRITFNRRRLEGSDALVFYSWDLRKNDLPKGSRDQNQVWVYYQTEAPTFTQHDQIVDLRDYPNFFNWTMTYRRASDVYDPYGYILPLPLLNSTTNQNHCGNANCSIRKLGERPKLLAWIVSDAWTNSRRELFAKQLQKYIPISIYGKCGEPCPTSKPEECYDHVAKTHKFYLSFENSLCMDYITEKFFYALSSSMVPVVYGGGRSEEYSAIAPKGSYIDARDFRSPKELAEYLVHLDQNEEEYLKYFEWKKKFKVVAGQGWCNLCQRVFEQRNISQGSGSPEHKAYKDLFSWWNYRSYDPMEENKPNVTPSWQDVIEESSKKGLGTAACTPQIKALTQPEGEKKGVGAMTCPPKPG